VDEAFGVEDSKPLSVGAFSWVNTVIELLSNVIVEHLNPEACSIITAIGAMQLINDLRSER